MEYLPPPSWPPPADWPPPCDDWKPSPYWTPKRGFPISPGGGNYLLPSPPGTEYEQVEASEDEQRALNRSVATRMLALWSRTVMSNAHSYYQAAMKAAWTDRAIEHNEDWSPLLSDLTKALDQVWVRGYFLVMAAYQMERWLQAYGEGDASADEIEHLRALRNSLEHLEGATFSEFAARKGGPNRAHSIEYLPGKELFLGFSADYIERAFGIVDLREVTDRARQYMYLDFPPEPDYSDHKWSPDHYEHDPDDE